MLSSSTPRLHISSGRINYNQHHHTAAVNHTCQSSSLYRHRCPCVCEVYSTCGTSSHCSAASIASVALAVQSSGFQSSQSGHKPTRTYYTSFTAPTITNSRISTDTICLFLHQFCSPQHQTAHRDKSFTDTRSTQL